MMRPSRITGEAVVTPGGAGPNVQGLAKLDASYAEALTLAFEYVKQHHATIHLSIPGLRYVKIEIMWPKVQMLSIHQHMWTSECGLDFLLRGGTEKLASTKGRMEKEGF